MGALLIVLGLVCVGSAGLFYLFTRNRGARTDDDATVDTRIGADGFFVMGNLRPGTEVQYACMVDGAWRNGTVAVAGIQTYVYTGTPPTEVRIVNIAVPESEWVQSPPSSSSSNDDVFTGFPSAY